VERHAGVGPADRRGHRPDHHQQRPRDRQGPDLPPARRHHQGHPRLVGHPAPRAPGQAARRHHPRARGRRARRLAQAARARQAAKARAKGKTREPPPSRPPPADRTMSRRTCPKHQASPARRDHVAHRRGERSPAPPPARSARPACGSRSRAGTPRRGARSTAPRIGSRSPHTSAIGPVKPRTHASPRRSAGRLGCSLELGTIRASASGPARSARRRSGQRYAAATSPAIDPRSPCASHNATCGTPSPRNSSSRAPARAPADETRCPADAAAPAPTCWRARARRSAPAGARRAPPRADRPSPARPARGRGGRAVAMTELGQRVGVAIDAVLARRRLVREPEAQQIRRHAAQSRPRRGDHLAPQERPGRVAVQQQHVRPGALVDEVQRAPAVLAALDRGVTAAPLRQHARSPVRLRPATLQADHLAEQVLARLALEVDPLPGTPRSGPHRRAAPGPRPRPAAAP
jgi:hypothetical protein